MSAVNKPRDTRRWDDNNKPPVVTEQVNRPEKENAVEPVIKSEVKPEMNVPRFEPYLVRVTVSALNVRKGPDTKYDVVTCIRDRGVYAIMREANQRWGKLKTGEGWINLDYTNKI